MEEQKYIITIQCHVTVPTRELVSLLRSSARDCAIRVPGYICPFVLDSGAEKSVFLWKGSVLKGMKNDESVTLM